MENKNAEKGKKQKKNKEKEVKNKNDIEKDRKYLKQKTSVTSALSKNSSITLWNQNYLTKWVSKIISTIEKKILKPLISYPGNLVYMVTQWLLVAPG